MCQILFTSFFLAYAWIQSNVYVPDQLQFMFLICFNRWCVCMDHEDFEKLCAIAFRIVAATHKENCSCQCSFCDICHIELYLLLLANGTSSMSRYPTISYFLFQIVWLGLYLQPVCFIVCAVFSFFTVRNLKSSFIVCNYLDVLIVWAQKPELYFIAQRVIC